MTKVVVACGALALHETGDRGLEAALERLVEREDATC
jgi:hypothetical protein